MKQNLIISLLLLFFFRETYATCLKSPKLWRDKIGKSKNIEQFFIDNYGCQKQFYKALNSSEKIYFDTVLYPYNLKKSQYINRWLAIAYNDKIFFDKFTFFNNYFQTHRERITTHQLHCFEKQQGFEEPMEKREFFHQLERRKMSNSVSYLYPLIRWSYGNVGIDMKLSRARVKKAEQVFGIRKGKIGDNEQFARYIALFDREYDAIASELSKKIKLPKIEAYKLLLTLTYLESRGNIFAVSKTGAFGPLQLTMHFYMMYGEPNNPFNPKSSMIKLINKFIHYNRVGKSLDESVIAYKSGSLTKCRDEVNLKDADCKYYNDFKYYMYAMRKMRTKSEVSRYFTRKCYISKRLNRLKRYINPNGIKHYEPYQYAVIKSNILRRKRRDSMYLNGGYFKSLGKMKRSDIYYLQDRYGVSKIGVISDKKVCY